MLPGILESGATLLIDQPRRRIRKLARRIAERFAPFRLEVKHPAGAEALQDIVGARTGGEQLGLGRGLEIGTAEPSGALAAARDRKSGVRGTRGAAGVGM